MKLLLLLLRGTDHPSYRLLCCEYSSGTALHCTYNQKVMKRLFRLRLQQDSLRKTSACRYSETAQVRAQKETGKVPICTLNVFARVFCFLHLCCINDRDSRANRGSMREALNRIPLQYHGRPPRSG